MFFRTLSVLAFLISNAACAQSFDVQIGAFKNADVAQMELPANVGDLRRTFEPDGLTRFLVGPFFNRTEAQQARDRLRAAGFNGAFVRKNQSTSYTLDQNVAAPTEQASYTSDQTSYTSDADTASSVSQRELDKLLTLSDEERRDLVYLDGVLHRKVDGQFIPLRD